MKLTYTKSVFLLWLLCLSANVFAQNITIERVDPTFWWVGMKNPKLQLMVKGSQLELSAVKLQKYKGVKLTKVSIAENPHYAFFDLEISAKAKPGKLVFDLTSDGSKTLIYELKSRESRDWEGVSQRDVMYLLMPDRFANGDTSNDSFKDMADTLSDRNNPWLRHGGDLAGVEQHLSYFEDLGVTTLWLNPVIENNQPLTNEGGNMRSAYHGYGFTDHYQIDKRLGGNQAYKDFVKAAHEKGLKVIQDAVYNHVGINHYFLKDMPMKSWLHQWDEYTNTSYKDQPVLDPHASNFDRKQTLNGWFVPFLPDLNQDNPYVVNYLIQHAIWTVENFHIDGYRIDTYMYNDMEFMNKCNDALLSEFPHLFQFGESLASSIPNQAAFTRNHMTALPFDCNLESTVDYQLHKAMLTSLNESFGWNEGVNRLYQTYAQDYLYLNSDKLVSYLDNHDEDRFLSVVNEDIAKFKMGLVWLLTSPRIPQIYYGTEIAMKNFKNPTDAEVRKDFPGGWSDDERNAFVKSGRSNLENETFEFIKKLIDIRKNHEAIYKGEFTQFLPFDNGAYVYFKVSENECIGVFSNAAGETKQIDLKRFKEILGDKTQATDLLSEEHWSLGKSIELTGKTAKIISFK